MRHLIFATVAILAAMMPAHAREKQADAKEQADFKAKYGYDLAPPRTWKELDEIAVTPTELARQLRVPANRITQIVQGKRSITGDTALRLGHWFGTNPQFWLNLQSAYDIRVAQSEAGKEIARLPTRQAAG